DQCRVDALARRYSDMEDAYPLTSMQEGILFHTLYAPVSAMYAPQLCLGLDGALDMDAFRGAWQLIVDRHPALRTVFVDVTEPRPLQIVLAAGSVRVPVDEEDARGLSADEQEARLSLAASRAR